MMHRKSEHIPWGWWLVKAKIRKRIKEDRSQDSEYRKKPMTEDL